MRDVGASASGATSIGAAIGAQIKHHVSHYAENPRAHAKALRKLGVSAAKVREVHRTMMPTHQQRLAPLTKHVKPLSHDEQLRIGVDEALRQNKIKVAGNPLNKVGHALSPTLTGLGEAGLYAAPGLAITAKNVATGAYHDAGSTLHGKPTLSRTGHAAKPLVPDVRRDIHAAKHGDLSGAILDAVAVASAGAGGAARVGAAGRAVRAGEGVGRAIARKGHEGGSLLHAPEPGTVKLQVGDTTVEKPLSRNALRRVGQRARYAHKQARLDQGPVAEEGSNAFLRSVERNASPEASFGRELRANRRVEQSRAQGEVLALERASKRLTRGEHAAMRVAAIEGHRALAHPGAVVARQIATHRNFIAEGQDVAAHEANIRDLKLAAHVLSNPSDRFLRALDATRALANHGEQESIARGFLTRQQAEARKAKIAAVYGGKHDEGSFYFHAGKQTGRRGIARFYNPRPSNTGMGKATTGRYAPELGHTFTGSGIKRGFVPLNIPKTVAQAYGRRLHLHSAHDVYDALRGASTETRASRYQVPIRATASISKQLKKYLSTIEENIHASPEELRALTKTETERLTHELGAAEHGSAPLGAKIAGVRWVDRRFIKDLGENSVRGPVERVADAINNPARFLTLYLRPAYALNALGNAAMLGVTHGHHAPHALWEAFRSEKLHGTHNTAVIDYLSGGGRALSQAVDTGFAHRGAEGLARFWNTATDLHARRAAWLAEAKRLGFDTPKKINALLNDAEHGANMTEITRRARKSIGDFDSLTPLERNTIRRLIYFYPWLRVATQWTGHMLTEHPVKSAVLAADSHGEAAHVKHVLGLLPQWAHLAGIVPVGGKSAAGLVDTVNPSSINTPASAVQTLAAIPNTVRGVIGLKQKGTSGLGDLLTPAGELFATAGGQTSDRNGRGGLIGAMQSTSVASTLRRAGVNPGEIFGHTGKTFPERGAKAALEPWAIGGLARRVTDVNALNEQGRKEQRALLSPPERVTDSFHTFRTALSAAVKQYGYDGIPKPLDGRLRLRYERAQARIKANVHRLDGEERQRAALAADLGVIYRHQWIDAKQYAAAKRNLATATPSQLKSSSRYLTEHYFDPDGQLSDATRVFTEYRTFIAEIQAAKQAGTLPAKDARAALKWTRTSDIGVDDLRSAREYLRSHYKPPRGGWPSVAELKLPALP